MSTFRNDEETTPLFVVNEIGATFGIPKEIFTDHGSHFQNKMMFDLTSKLGLKKEHSSPYYPQANGQVEVVNKSLNIFLQWTINSGKYNWNFMLYSTLWYYQTSIKTTSIFSSFQLIYGLEEIFPIKFQISSLNLVLEVLLNTTPLEENILISRSSMRSIEMQPSPMRLTNNMSSVSMISLSSLKFSLKLILY